MKSLDQLKPNFKCWEIIKDLIDQNIDIMLNMSQSGHPGGSRSKTHSLVATMLSGAMRYDLRNPQQSLRDRIVMVGGHVSPLAYSALAVFNEALRRKSRETGDAKYNHPLGDDYTLFYEDLIGFRRSFGLSGHVENEGKTLFYSFNTGPSAHGSPAAAGMAMALKHANCGDVKVFAFEGEGGFTAGVTHETLNSAYGLGLGNLVFVLDWNDFGIDDRPFSSVMAGTPQEWFEGKGFCTVGVENGENWEEIISAYAEILDENADPNQPKAIWMKTQKGRGYHIFDNDSHGAPHKRNSELFWKTKQDFSEKYNIEIPFMNQSAPTTYEEAQEQTKAMLDAVYTIFDQTDGLTDYLADALVELGDSVPEKIANNRIIVQNPLKDSEILDVENYPEDLFAAPGTVEPNRAGFAKWGSFVNSVSQKKYGRPLFLVASADLADSTNIAGFAKGRDGVEDFGMYNRDTNLNGVLLPQGITEMANAGICTGIVATNLSGNQFSDFNGYCAACSTYGAFSYLKYGSMRLFSQMAQDSQFKFGKVIWVAGHSGPETAEDGKTHFGIFAPGVTELFPEGQVLNLHPWEHNEVAPMLATAMKMDAPIIALHLTRPGIEIPNRTALGMDSHLESAKGAYLIRDYDENCEKVGVVILRGTSTTAELMKILPKINENGPNVKIVAAVSLELFISQNDDWKNRILTADERKNAMVITNGALSLMHRWHDNPNIKDVSLSPDWDNRWRTGGTGVDVIADAHLTAEFQWKAIKKFSEKN